MGTPTFTPTATSTPTNTPYPHLHAHTNGDAHGHTNGDTNRLSAADRGGQRPSKLGFELGPCRHEWIRAASPTDHYWLTRPFAAEFKQDASHYYPYASDGRGDYLPHHGVDTMNCHGNTGVYPRLTVRSSTQETISSKSGALIPTSMATWSWSSWTSAIDDEPVYCLYGHLSKTPGGNRKTLCRPGRPVGEVGMSGIALGPHLHLEVRVGGLTYGDTRNPEFWLKPFRGYGTIAGRVLTQKGCLVSNLLLNISRTDGEPGRYVDVFTYLQGRFQRR